MKQIENEHKARLYDKRSEWASVVDHLRVVVVI